MGLNIIPRAQWGARYAPGFGPAPPADEIYLHHSVTIAPDLVPPWDDDDEAMRTLERIGQQRFGHGVSYTFAAMPSGRLYEGAGPLRVGSHTGGRNTRSRGIVLVGDYTRSRPTGQQLTAVAQLVRHGRAAGWWTVGRLTGGHRDAPGASTACPGAAAYDLIGEINRRAALGEEEDDMTPEQEERLKRVERGVELILQQLVGPGATILQPFPGEAREGGWPHWREGQPARRWTLVDYVRGLDRDLHADGEHRSVPLYPSQEGDGHGDA